MPYYTIPIVSTPELDKDGLPTGKMQIAPQGMPPGGRGEPKGASYLWWSDAPIAGRTALTRAQVATIVTTDAAGRLRNIQKDLDECQRWSLGVETIPGSTPLSTAELDRLGRVREEITTGVRRR